MVNTAIESLLQEENPLIVIASNRGPYAFSQTEEGQFTSRRGAGGLVTALAALVERLDVLWVANALSEDDKAWASQHQNNIENVDGIDLKMVITEEDAYHQYYNIIANPLLWFIQHQMWNTPRDPSIDADIWSAWKDGYIAINRQFAQVIADSVKQELKKKSRPVYIFPQDYHLYLVPHFLRKFLGHDVYIQPFVHIPWPGPDAWRVLPSQMRNTLISSLLDSDNIGFQTQRDAFNFVQCARFYLPDAHSYGSRDSITYKGRKVGAHAYPISVDVEKIDEMIQEPQTRLHKGQVINLIGDRKLILRIDRIEPSKNILRGLQAYRTLLDQHPEHHGRVQMLSLLVPSRMDVQEYKDYLGDIMVESGMINAAYSDEFWEPSRIILGNNYHRALAAMQLYDVLLVNPIADGMNLVAKEGTLVNGRDGVLVLSEHAGAFYELGQQALTVSPFDIYGTAQVMHEALTMPLDERAKRAQALENIVRKNGVRTWFSSQIEDAMTAFKSQSKKSSTPSTPAAKQSAEIKTTEGVSSD
ncbi:MAG: trehalose-6-phosphate synthase [Anaerolineaceae bacterium]|nr:trehalose-6-phosphate synthase [Anaerolineaceae bacterium]